MNNSGADTNVAFFLNRNNHLAISAAIAVRIMEWHLRAEFESGTMIGNSWYSHDGTMQRSLCTDAKIASTDVFNPIYSLPNGMAVSDRIDQLGSVTMIPADRYTSAMNLIAVESRKSGSVNPILNHLFGMLVWLGRIDDVVEEARYWIVTDKSAVRTK